jgi:hypothetical protein
MEGVTFGRDVIDGPEMRNAVIGSFDHRIELGAICLDGGSSPPALPARFLQ